MSRSDTDPRPDPEPRLSGHLEQQRANKPSRAARTVSVGNVLKGVLRNLKLVSKLRRQRIHRAWAVAMGHSLIELSHTRVVRHAGGELTVEIDSAALLQEYARFRKPELIDRLNAHLQGKPQIHDIRFVLGAFQREPDDPSDRDEAVDVP